MKTIEYFFITIIAACLLSVVVFNLTGCTTMSHDSMAQCRNLCRAPVGHYQDDVVDCVCSPKSVDDRLR